MLDAGKVPGTAWLGVCFGIAAFASDLWAARRDFSMRAVNESLLRTTLAPVLAAILALQVAPTRPDTWLSALVTLAIIVPMGPNLYRIAFRPLAESSVLTMFIAAIGAHFAMTGLGLVFFGAEGLRARPLSGAVIPMGPLIVTGQILYIYAITLVSMIGLALFFGRTLAGKALIATAMNRLGARLVAVRTEIAGRLSFALAALIGALSGILIAPMTTVFYDTGFLIGLKEIGRAHV